MRVVIVGHGPPTTGGIPSFVTRLARDSLLRERCERVDFLNTHPPGVKEPGRLNLSNMFLTFAHARAIFRLGRRADIVHLNLAATPFLPLLRAMFLSLAGKVSGSGVILHAHTGEIQNCVAQRSYRILLRLVMKLVDALVVVSTEAKTAVQSLGASNVHLLENGINIGEFPVGPKKDDPPLLVFLGTVCERKGLIDLRDSLVHLLRNRGSHLPVEVVIIGDGEQEGPGTFERVKEAYSTVGLKGIDFRGAIPHNEVVNVLAGASIFCLPSHTEGFPISVLEAMACHAAIIASRAGDIPRMLDEGRAGILIEVGDVAGLQAAVSRLIEDREERTRLGRAARARAEQEYGYDRMIRRLFFIYEESAGNDRSANVR